MQTTYAKPEITKIDKMIFPFEAFKKTCINKWCEEKKENCYRECTHFAPMGCRKCSSCHGCR